MKIFKSIFFCVMIMTMLSSNSAWSNHPVSGTEITVQNTETKKTYTTKTNKKGKFSFRKLPKGTYEVKVKTQGGAMWILDKNNQRLMVSSPDSKKSTGRSRKNPTVTIDLDRSNPKLAADIKNWVKDTYEGKERAKSPSKDYNSSRSNTSSSMTGTSGSNSSSRMYNKRKFAEAELEKRDRRMTRRSLKMQRDQEIDKGSAQISLTFKADRLEGHVTILK